MIFHQKQAKHLNQQLVSASVKYSLLQTLRNPLNCQCHFDPNQNKLIPEENLKIDTTKDPIPDIDLTAFRIGCDFDTDDNLIAKENTEINGGYGLKVSNVMIKDIKLTGTPHSYSGDLSIVYEENDKGIALKPVTVPILLEVDSSSIATKRSISSCGAYDPNSNILPLIQAVKVELSHLSTHVHGSVEDRLTSLEQTALLCTPSKADVLAASNRICDPPLTCAETAITYAENRSNECVMVNGTAPCGKCGSEERSCGGTPHGKARTVVLNKCRRYYLHGYGWGTCKWGYYAQCVDGTWKIGSKNGKAGDCLAHWPDAQNAEWQRSNPGEPLPCHNDRWGNEGPPI